MISIVEACAKVDGRMHALDRAELANEMSLVDFQAAGITCAGTDVPSVELIQLLGADVTDILAKAEGSVCSHGARCVSNCVLEAFIRGCALRCFWLGYEYGKDAEAF